MICNILSYFVKDIKDQHELAFYKQIITLNTIKIFYKDEILYIITNYKMLCFYKGISDFKSNIIKDYFNNTLSTYKSCSNKNKYVYLYYNKDNIIHIYNPNYIYYEFKHKKYLNKVCIKYLMKSRYLIISKIKYYNCSKYIYKFPTNFKYNGVQILIMNKYELYYNNLFYNLFFVRGFAALFIALIPN
jgi:hypothetical protein